MVWALKGHIGIDPPPEMVVLDRARDWGIPPWVLEEQCSERWWKWGNAYAEALNRARKKE